jgi:hypothetical protein
LTGCNPAIGPLIRGGHGIRKVRVAIDSQDDIILLLYAYRKNVTTDLTPRQVAQLAKVVLEKFGDEGEHV